MKITRRQLRQIIKEELHDITVAKRGLFESTSHMMPTCSRQSIQVGSQNIVVEVADTDFLRQRGLMFRHGLPINEGMLFVFPEASKQNFWMKNTNVPLSIAFINSEGVILNIEDMNAHSLAEARSRGPVLYALEMNCGWFDDNHVCVGDRVSLL